MCHVRPCSCGTKSCGPCVEPFKRNFHDYFPARTAPPTSLARLSPCARTLGRLPRLRNLLPLRTGKISTQDAAPSCSHRVTTASLQHDEEARHGFGRMGFGSSRCPCSFLGFFFFFFPEMFWLCTAPIAAGARITGGGAESVHPAATTSSTASIATTSPRFSRCSSPPHHALFFPAVSHDLISHAMRCASYSSWSRGSDWTQNDGHEVGRRAIESVRLVFVRCIILCSRYCARPVSQLDFLLILRSAGYLSGL
jgi:hypothetical protein